MTTPRPPQWQDLGALRGMLTSYTGKHQQSRDALTAHFTRYPGYVAWSGGKDSTVAVHLATRINPEVPVVWFDSGLEFPETRHYIKQITELWDLNLHEYHPRYSALHMLRQSGSFTHAPEPARAGEIHNLHTVLVSEPAHRAHTDFGPGEVTGVRAGESVGRRIFLSSRSGEYARRDGAFVCAPLWNWSTSDVGAYLHTHGIPENPVYRKLRELGAPEWAQRVGLVVDGNAAEYGRFTWLRVGWPELWSELVDVLPRLQEWR